MLAWGAWMKQFILFSPSPQVNEPLPNRSEAEREESLPPKLCQTAKTAVALLLWLEFSYTSLLIILYRKAVTEQLAEHCLALS